MYLLFKPEFRGLEQLAWLMDRAITIPGTNISIGLDALLGLLPVGGDVMTGIIQTGQKENGRKKEQKVRRIEKDVYQTGIGAK